MYKYPVYFSESDITQEQWRRIIHPDHHVFICLDMARGQVLDGGRTVLSLMFNLYRMTGVELGGVAKIVPMCVSQDVAFYGEIFHAPDINACARLHAAIEEVGLPAGVTYQRKNSKVLWEPCHTRVKCIGNHDGVPRPCVFCAAWHA